MKISTKNGVEFGTSIKSIKIPNILLQRIPIGLDYMDIVTGGLTPSSVTLFTGTPGSGKTSMMLSTADCLVEKGAVVVFNTCEESVYQIKNHSMRLHLKNPFLVAEESFVEDLLTNCEKIKKQSPNKHFVLIVDSLQMLNDKIDDQIKSSTSVRCLEMIISWCKQTCATAIIIGQVGKSGKASGQNRLLHLVDSCLSLSIETTQKSAYVGCRVLEMEKHRFGKSHIQVYLRVRHTGFSILGVTGDPDDF